MTTHLTPGKRVLVVVYVADLMEHRKKCEYNLGPRRIAELADYYGLTRDRLAFFDPIHPSPHETVRLYTEAQFTPLLHGTSKASAFLHATAHILKRVVEIRPSVVLLVGGQRIPEDLLRTLKTVGIEIVFIHTSFAIPNRLKPYADVVISAKEFALGRATPEQLVRPESLFDVLERQSTVTARQFQDILTATPLSVPRVSDALHAEERKGTLSPWVTTLLAVFALLPRTRTGQLPAPLPRQALFLRLAMRGVDVERVVIPILHFLCDEGTLRHDGEDYFPSPEVNDAARQIAGLLARDSDDAANDGPPPSSSSEAANRIIAAFEIFLSTPEQFDPPSARTMKKYLNYRLGTGSKKNQRRQLQEMGLDAITARKLEQALDAFLEGSAPASDRHPKALPGEPVKKAANARPHPIRTRPRRPPLVGVFISR